MINLKFRCQNEFVLLKIDRKNKQLWVATSKTNYKLVKTDWLNLFDKRKEKAQDSLSEKLSDKEFKILITLAMAEKGYKEYGSTDR